MAGHHPESGSEPPELRPGAVPSCMRAVVSACETIAAASRGLRRRRRRKGPDGAPSTAEHPPPRVP